MKKKDGKMHGHHGHHTAHHRAIAAHHGDRGGHRAGTHYSHDGRDEVHETREFANMPQHVVMKEYPKGGYSGDEHLDDTIVRLDGDSYDAAHKMRSNRPGSMY